MARKNGKCLGPPVKWQPGTAKQARRLMAGGELTAQEVANVLKVSRRTLYVGGRRLPGANAGLVVAELELRDEGQAFEKPPWVGEDVTNDRRYGNSSLARHPFVTWGADRFAPGPCD